MGRQSAVDKIARFSRLRDPSCFVESEIAAIVVTALIHTSLESTYISSFQKLGTIQNRFLNVNDLFVADVHATGTTRPRFHSTDVRLLRSDSHTTSVWRRLLIVPISILGGVLILHRRVPIVLPHSGSFGCVLGLGG